MGIKVVIFDWGRTLFDSETKKEFPESEAILAFCKERGLKLGLVSLVSAQANATLNERTTQIMGSPIKKFFDEVAVTDKDKDEILDKMVLKFSLPRKEIVIVDDRMIRGIKYGNEHGHPTVWLQRGKFSNELPDETSGMPTYTIRTLAELEDILIKL